MFDDLRIWSRIFEVKEIEEMFICVRGMLNFLGGVFG